MKIRPLTIVLFVILLTLLLSTVGLFLVNQNTITKTFKTLKVAVSKDFYDPESARFRNLQLKSTEPPVLDRLGVYRLAARGENGFA